MAEALAHRGPDGAGVTIHSDGHVGLVHTRLAVVEPGPAGDQPISHERRWWMVFNGEVFDHQRLRRRLPARRYRGRGDGETLLHALASRGMSVLSELEGFFAIAAHDVERRRVSLARDPLGVKPLYWARHAGGVWFASEMRALLAAGLPTTPDRDALRGYFGWTWVHGERVPLAGIRRVLPGELLTIDVRSGEVEARRYLTVAELVDRDRARAFERQPRARGLEQLAGALGRSVERRLQADVPVGTLCSGGVDSSVITALANRASPGLPAYVASVPSQPRIDERAWARATCEHVGAQLRVVEIEADAWRHELVRSTLHFEYPLWHASSVSLALIARAAREDGVEVLLGGEGADEVLGGYAHRHVAEREAFAAQARRRLAAPPGCDPTFWIKGQPLAELCAAPDELVEDERWRARLLAELDAAYDHHTGPRKALEVALAAELQLFLSPALARADKNLMQYSIEYREPFLDREVVSLGLNVPLEWRVEPSVKGLLRDLAFELIPRENVVRPKLGFKCDTMPFLTGALRPEFLSQASLPDVLKIGARRWADAVAHAHEERTLFRLVVAEIWCRAFLAGEDAAAIEDALWAARDSVFGGDP